MQLYFLSYSAGVTVWPEWREGLQRARKTMSASAVRPMYSTYRRVHAAPCTHRLYRPSGRLRVTAHAAPKHLLWKAGGTAGLVYVQESFRPVSAATEALSAWGAFTWLLHNPLAVLSVAVAAFFLVPRVAKVRNHVSFWFSYHCLPTSCASASGTAQKRRIVHVQCYTS